MIKETGGQEEIKIYKDKKVNDFQGQIGSRK